LEEVPVPQLVICSSAVRTRQTAGLVVEATGVDLPLDSYDALYGAEPELVLQYVREIDEEVVSVLVVGHNPTLYQLAWQLLPDRPASDDGDQGERSRLEAHGFPTCALAVLNLAVPSWEDAAEGSAGLEGVFAPPY
jgi:phosphohistidine phosphatase